MFYVGQELRARVDIPEVMNDALGGTLCAAGDTLRVIGFEPDTVPGPYSFIRVIHVRAVPGPWFSVEQHEVEPLSITERTPHTPGQGELF